MPIACLKVYRRSSSLQLRGESSRRGTSCSLFTRRSISGGRRFLTTACYCLSTTSIPRGMGIRLPNGMAMRWSSTAAVSMARFGWINWGSPQPRPCTSRYVSTAKISDIWISAGYRHHHRRSQSVHAALGHHCRSEAQSEYGIDGGHLRRKREGHAEEVAHLKSE